MVDQQFRERFDRTAELFRLRQSAISTELAAWQAVQAAEVEASRKKSPIVEQMGISYLLDAERVGTAKRKLAEAVAAREQADRAFIESYQLLVLLPRP